MPKSLQYARSKGKAIKYNQYWREKQMAFKIAEDTFQHLMSTFTRVPKSSTDEDDRVRCWCIRCNRWVDLNMTREKLTGTALEEYCNGEDANVSRCRKCTRKAKQSQTR